jgi:hypothetical protein
MSTRAKTESQARDPNAAMGCLLLLKETSEFRMFGGCEIYNAFS